jgi:3D (Asp-Asp-Asp) domain-containing protein
MRRLGLIASVILASLFLSGVSAAAAETTRSVYNTAYADQDNDPPGSNAIAFPKSGGNPTVHNGTGGSCTYADPTTLAVDSRDFPPGTRIYVPSMLCQFMVEDSCAACIADRNAGNPTRIDFFVGGKSATNAQTQAYESSITSSGATRQIIVNPDPCKNVIVGPLYETNRKTANNGAGVPDPTACTASQPATVPTLKVPPVYGWNSTNGVYGRNDGVLSFKDGAIRVSGTGYPAAEIDQEVVSGQQYTATVTVAAVVPPNSAGSGWLKITNADSSVVYFEKLNFNGPQTFTFTANSPIIRVWAGAVAEDVPFTVDLRDLSFAPVTGAVTPPPGGGGNPDPGAVNTTAATLLKEETFQTLDWTKYLSVWDYSVANQGVRGYNNEDQFYVRQGSSLAATLKSNYGYEPWTIGTDAGGKYLELKAIRTPSAVASQTVDPAQTSRGQAPWLSGMFNTEGKYFPAASGYIEANIKLPNAPGTLPAWWALLHGGATADEIDFVEVPKSTDGSQGRTGDIVYSTAHNYAGTETHKTVQKTLAGLSTDYHLFGVEFSGSDMNFYLDRVLYGTLPRPSRFATTPLFLIGNLAVGGDWPGSPPSTVSEITMRFRSWRHFSKRPF